MIADTAESEADDSALALQASQGDRAAFAALVTRHYGFIHSVAWRWCRDRAVAEDIAQTVCIKLGGAIRTWRRDSAFRTWLYRLTLNAAHDQARAAAREARKVQSWASHMSVTGQTDLQAHEPEDDHDLWAAVRTLPDKQRDAVLLVYGEEMSHGDAAAVMDCAESTVSYHLHAARKRLKLLLNEAGEAR